MHVTKVRDRTPQRGQDLLPMPMIILDRYGYELTIGAISVMRTYRDNDDGRDGLQEWSAAISMGLARYGYTDRLNTFGDDVLPEKDWGEPSPMALLCPCEEMLLGLGGWHIFDTPEDALRFKNSTENQRSAMWVSTICTH